jgi:hypothetical protein
MRPPKIASMGKRMPQFAQMIVVPNAVKRLRNLVHEANLEIRLPRMRTKSTVHMGEGRGLRGAPEKNRAKRSA